MQFGIQITLMLVGVYVGFLVNAHPQLLPGLPVPTVDGNTLANAVCEENGGTHLLCDGIGSGHQLLTNNYPANVVLKNCEFLIGTPHCCTQMCRPAESGTCDSSTGACICSETGGGPVNVCNAMNDTTKVSPNDNAVMEACTAKCNANRVNRCKTPGAVTDGVNGFICVCYCQTTT